MDFRWTKEQEAFRDEVREWMAEQMRDVPESAKSNWFSQTEPTPEGLEVAKRFLAERVKKGWNALAWPKKFGGGGAGVVEQMMFEEEMCRFRVPRVYGTGTGGGADIIISHGTEEQQKRFLPKILRGEIIFWTCFTEPGGGSDLANLKTRATRSGDGYILDGAKMFVGDSHPVDYLYLWARTNPDVPKHAGISAFLVNARAPGVEIRGMQSIAANRKNIVFLDKVYVPAADRLGDENQGWYLAMSNLRDQDRSGASGSIFDQMILGELVKFCRDTEFNGAPLIEDPHVQRRLGELAAELRAMRLAGLRNLWMQAERQKFTYQGTLSDLRLKLFMPRFAAGLLEITQRYGTLKGGPWAALGGTVEYDQRYSLMTHAHGTPEVLKTVIARRGLGLPRGS